jgi:hypothetical protein
VNVSQLTFSTHDVSVLTLPPTIGGEPCCQVADGPPGLGPTVPVEGVGVAKTSTNPIAQSRPRPQIKKNAPIAARPEWRCVDAVLIGGFLFNLSFGSDLISGRKRHTHTFLCQVRPDMLSVCDDATIAAEGSEKAVILKLTA